MKIIKILNNNAVVCSGKDGKETIAMGRGIAFQQKAGNIIDDSKIEKKFVLHTEEKSSRFQKFIKDIPMEDVFLAEKIISHAQKSAKKTFDDSIYITLTDHLNSALERSRKGITVKNPLTGAIKSFYPAEFQMGEDAVKIIKEERGIQFSIDETAFFTMHFVTAELGENGMEFNGVLSFVNDISSLVKESLKNSVNEASISWQRFITHISFFAQRIFSGSEAEEKDSPLYDSVSSSFPKAFLCVEKICDYVKENHSHKINKDEQTYLMIHINRLQEEFGVK